jgi:hypothetical protein
MSPDVAGEKLFHHPVPAPSGLGCLRMIAISVYPGLHVPPAAAVCIRLKDFQ